jgi:hypothetical protein
MILLLIILIEGSRCTKMPPTKATGDDEKEIRRERRIFDLALRWWLFADC